VQNLSGAHLQRGHFIFPSIEHGPSAILNMVVLHRIYNPFVELVIEFQEVLHLFKRSGLILVSLYGH
jgi:hypothetical protein